MAEIDDLKTAQDAVDTSLAALKAKLDNAPALVSTGVDPAVVAEAAARAATQAVAIDEQTARLP